MSVSRTGLWVLLALGVVACGVEGPPPEGIEAESTSSSLAAGAVRLRLMAANLTSGTAQSYTPGEGARILQGTHPDVVMLQEFNYGGNTAAEIRSFIDTAFGTSFSYFREAGAQIPNGVVSRYPILAAGEWDDPRVTNRDFAWARIDIPGPVDLWAISVHLLTTSTTERNLEAQSLVSFIQANVPAGDYVAIGGDYNTSSRTEACITTLSQVVTTAGPYPADRNGNSFTNAARAKPYDWMLVSSGLQALKTATDLGASSFANGLVADTRVYSPIAELSPALTGDSGATNMQHMGVVRDFGVPSDAAVPSVTVTAPNGGESWAGGSSHAITWTSANVSNVRLEASMDGGSTWSVLVSSTASTGSYTWTVPSTATTSALVRVSDTASATADASNATFTITVTAPPSGSVFINEVLVNEVGSDVTTEFVELVNGTAAAVDLSGWTVSDATLVRHTFASGSTVAAGAAVVVFGGAAGIPAGLTNAVAASTGTLGLSNSGDSVTVKNGAGVVIDTVTLASSLTSTDGVSANRSPDASSSGSWVLHTAVSTLQRSPGTRADGTGFAGGGGGGGGGSTAITAESEANDTAATADAPVGNGKAISGSIGSSTDQDWFKVTVKAAGTVTVAVSVPGTADLDWYLYAAANTSTYVARGYTTANPETGTYAASAGDYYVKVVGYGGATSGYTLTVSGASGVIDP
jgi:endonuclease/exonuclease/phosphatase family metal-dependent hydrolase